MNYKNVTSQKIYTTRLINRQFAWWKKIIDVQGPYRWNINRLELGFTLDLGCGIGRNLTHLKGNGVGIDHNENSVIFCKNKGLIAFTNEQFKTSKYHKMELFDSILLAHVAEHMSKDEAVDLLRAYIPFLKAKGKIVIITPQEAGYRSDSTHIEFIDFMKIKEVFKQLNLSVAKTYSFPFPRAFGKIFRHNEFICIGTKH